MYGSHLLLHWSRTQQTVALSSAEAELNAMCKGGQEGMAATVMADELGSEMTLRMRTDASAAIGVIKRQGAGKGEAPADQAVVASRKGARRRD